MDKTKSSNSGNFKVAGNWNTWSKQIKEKFARLGATDLKFEKTNEANKTVREPIQDAIRNAGKKQ